MGILYSSCVPNRDCKIVIMGLEGGGKTSIINWIKEGKALQEPPQVTYSFNYFECSKLGYNMKIFDIGGSDRKTTFWRHFLAGAQALIYVVDASNFTRLSESREQLHKILGFEAMHGVRTLILANKMDLQERKICQVASVELIRKELGLDNSFHEANYLNFDHGASSRAQQKQAMASQLACDGSYREYELPAVIRDLICERLTVNLAKRIGMS